MFGQRFQHLFPSPGLRTQSLKEIMRTDGQKQRKNFHINKESLNRPPIDLRKAKKTPDDTKMTFSRNNTKFRIAISSLEKIQRSLTPNLPKKRQDSVSHHKIPVKTEKSEKIQGEEKQKEIQVNLYDKILLFKTQQDETPMIFIKGKVDIYTEMQEQGGILLIHKLNNYSDKEHDCLSCRIVSTEKFIKKNELNLFPSDYEVVMAGFIKKVIQPRSTNKEIQVKGKWFSPPPKHPHLTLIMRDQREKKILFTTNCFSFQQIIKKTLEKNTVNLKIY